MSRRWRIAGILAVPAFAGFLFMANRIDARVRPQMHRPSHRHCIKQIGLGLQIYAGSHGGAWPSQTNGYDDALLLTLPYLNNAYSLLTGPGFDPGVFELAHTSRTDVPEDGCGRVYIQGLTETNAPNLIVLFDKRPSYGGDHFPARPFFPRPLLREVLFLAGYTEEILEKDWPGVVTQQVQWLVDAGFEREQAEWYYAQGER